MNYPSCPNIPDGSEKFPWCPGSYISCDANSTQYPSTFYSGDAQVVLSIISSSLSCLGSLLIVFSYWKWKDIRTGSRSVITFLAIADFFTAFGYIMGSINYAIHLNQPPATPQCVNFGIVCTIQSYITTWSSISSFLWTSALALYLYLTVVHSKIFLASKLIPYFHVVCWGVPILICLPLLITNNLGYSPYAASTWCYIYEPIQQRDEGLQFETVGLILVGGKLWEIASYFFVVGLYIAIKCHVKKQTKLGTSENILSAGMINIVKKADRKLTFIPIMFVLLRMWGTLQFFYSLIVSSSIVCSCTTSGIAIGFQILSGLQAIGDGGQGWGNFLLYVLASTKIRTRLFGWLIDCFQFGSNEPRHKPLSPRKDPQDRNKNLQSPSHDGDRHVDIITNRPVDIDVNKQSVTYQSMGERENTHEPTTTR